MKIAHLETGSLANHLCVENILVLGSQEQKLTLRQKKTREACLCFVTKLEIWGYRDSSVCKTVAAPSKDPAPTW